MSGDENNSSPHTNIRFRIDGAALALTDPENQTFLYPNHPVGSRNIVHQLAEQF